MKKVVKYLFIILVIASSMVACEHEPAITPQNTIDPNDGGGNGQNSCSPDSVYFVNDIFPILKSNCAFSGCHGDGSRQDGVDLSNYNSIISTADVRPFDLNGSDLYEVITENDADKIMPPPPANKLNQDQVALIAKWINQGALNNACNQCDTTNITFTLTISPIIKNNCQGCHSGGNPTAGINLTTYNEIKNQVNSGTLYGVINHEPGYTPMPYNQSKLSDCLVTQINKWITEGAQNN